MKTTIPAAIFAAVTLVLSACASTGKTGSDSAATSGVKPYPLTTCVVTGNDLGSMGDEQRIVYQGQEVKFCCEPCVDKFKKNPAKYLAKLN
jgi:hypothetical protein